MDRDAGGPDRWWPLSCQGQLSFVITATLFAIFAMSWSFFTSFSGYLNLGHVIFIGLAGYTSAALNFHLGWPLWLCMVVGVAVGTGGGWLYLNPIHRRITGLSFEMVSFLSIVAISNLIVSSYARPLDRRRHRPVSNRRLLQHDGIAAGACGDPLRRRLLLHPLPEVGLRARSSTSPGRMRPSSSRPVRTHIATRADCCLLSGLVGSIGGVLYVHYSGAAVVSNTFALALMIRIIVMAVIGGRFSLRGAILGAYLVVFLGMELMQYIDGYVQFLIIYGTRLHHLLRRCREGLIASSFEALWNRLVQRLPRRAGSVGQSVRA